MIRVRTIVMLVVPLILICGGLWYALGSRPNVPLGAGGLPLIKADTTPVKLPPEDPGGEVMPNAESTVFSAMGADGKRDPSMENLRLPEVPNAQTPAAEPDFAGLKTGFALPPEPEPTKKVESLFNADPLPANTDPVSAEAITPEAATGPAYYIQLAAMPDGSDTAAMWKKLSGQYADAIGDMMPVYENVDIKGKGKLIRIQAGPLASEQEANSRCARLHKIDRQGGCIVVKR